MVTVTVPARLHLGFFDLNGSLGRRFGGIGLAIGGLRTRATVCTAAHMQVTGPESERARHYLDLMRWFIGARDSHDLTINEVVPAHAGLGSGTQMALAIAAGMRRLHGLAVDIEGDAIRLGRGARSGIGIGLFHGGGLVMDGGRGQANTPPPIISRMTFPEEWRVLVVIDPDRRGMHGDAEHAAFASLPSVSDAEAGHLCRLVVMKALPALAEHDIVNFGAAVTELQARLGDYYAPVQGSRFTSPAVAALLDLLGREGAFGIGQSSWGPTGFAFTASEDEAKRLAAVARRHPGGRGLDIHICCGFNRGAQIVVHAPANARNQYPDSEVRQILR
jgi:beta-ribofuranosylaminobenzene 5'-phosphate synthase